MSKVTKKSLLAKLDGKIVRKRVVGGYCVEDMKIFRQSLVDQLTARAMSEDLLIEKESTFEVEGTNNYVFKPKMKRASTGKFTVKSKSYEFLEDGKEDASHGDLSKLTIEDGQLSMITLNGQCIVYEELV